MRPIPLAVLLAASLAAPGSAQNLGFIPGVDSTFRINDALLANAFPTHPLETGRWTVRLVPALVGYKEDETIGAGRSFQDVSGFGGVIGVTYAFSERWGVSSTNVLFRATGSGMTKNAAETVWGDETVRGVSSGLTAVYQPFLNESGFRLPLLAGLAFVSQTRESELTIGAASIEGQRQVSTLQWLGGVSPQWNLGRWFRFAPFLFFYKPMRDPSITCKASGAAVCGSFGNQEEGGSRTFGFEVTYRPWNLGTMIGTPAKNVTIWTLKWQRTF